MVTIEWVVLCESIFRDQSNRISLLGIASELPVPTLPLLLNEHPVVARLAGTALPQACDVAFGIATPAGLWVTPESDDAATVSVSGQYLIINLRAVPLRDEGVHRFEVGLGNGATAAVEIPVWLTTAFKMAPNIH